jgi:hypothetical protein
MEINTNSKILAMFSLVIVMFMSLLSLGLLSKFHEVMNTPAQI